MFTHKKELQFDARPDRSNPLLAKHLQELIGGQFGEISVMMQYLMQGWNSRGPQKYRDMLLAIGTEEIGHVEMLSTMVCRLLEDAPLSVQDEFASDPIVGTRMGGMMPGHLIVGGLGAMPVNSAGVPWSGGYIVASGNLLADFRANLNAESQGRLQAVRIYEETDDPGVRRMLSFLIARDTMHQNQWLAAIREIEEEGIDATPVPNSFPQSAELGEVAYQFWNNSDGQGAKGRWADGPSPDGKGTFTTVDPVRPLGEVPILGTVDPRVHGSRRDQAPLMDRAGEAVSTAAETIRRAAE